MILLQIFIKAYRLILLYLQKLLLLQFFLNSVEEGDLSEEDTHVVNCVIIHVGMVVTFQVMETKSLSWENCCIIETKSESKVIEWMTGMYSEN